MSAEQGSEDTSEGQAPFSPNTHIFVVRVWRERREIEGAPPLWRGEIEHVTSGARRAFQALDVIPAFIAQFLREWGVEVRGRRPWWPHRPKW